jgi:hypothetical protein
MAIWLHNLVNVGCELVGYYFAALLSEASQTAEENTSHWLHDVFHPLHYRYSDLPNFEYEGARSPWLQICLLLFLLLDQFGPNSTTFLVAGEASPLPSAPQHMVSQQQ